MIVSLQADEWVRSYCGLVMHDEGDHWLLSFWGYPIITGTEGRCGKVLAEIAANLAGVIERRDVLRGTR